MICKITAEICFDFAGLFPKQTSLSTLIAKSKNQKSPAFHLNCNKVNWKTLKFRLIDVCVYGSLKSK